MCVCLHCKYPRFPYITVLDKLKMPYISITPLKAVAWPAHVSFACNMYFFLGQWHGIQCSHVFPEAGDLWVKIDPC